MFWRLRLGITALALGGALLVASLREWQLGASSSPEDLTLEALIARGPNGNANVRISDFVLADDYAYFLDDSGVSWSSLLIPAVPKTLGEQSVHVLNPRVVVKSTHIPSENELETLRGRTQLQCLVVNRVEELGSEEKTLLSQDYPGLDVNKCLILEEGRQPSQVGKAFLLGGGLALLLGGGLLLYNFSRTQ